MDIYNIPISLITDQFIAYLELMKQLNIDFAGDFLYMAATLAHIKSKTLIPSNDDDDDDEDPRMEIARPLLEYLQLKSAAEYLSSQDMLGDATFAGAAPDNELSKESESDETINIDIFDLAEAYRILTERSYQDHSVDFTTNTLSVKERIIEIVRFFEANSSATFTELFKHDSGKSMMVVTFLAILEMAKLNLIEIRQHIQSGIIRIHYL